MIATTLLKVPIFLVEDDEVDIESVRRALKKENISNDLIAARDGVEAFDMLRGKDGHSKVTQPCIILLDINLPRMNGLQLLEEIRKDVGMKQNVVFMLTTSARDQDMKAAYDLQAAGYFLKENLSDFFRVLSGYCQINQLP